MKIFFFSTLHFVYVNKKKKNHTLITAIKSTESTMTQDEDWQSQKQDEEKSMLPLIGILVLIYAFIMYYIWF